MQGSETQLADGAGIATLLANRVLWAWCFIQSVFVVAGFAKNFGSVENAESLGDFRYVCYHDFREDGLLDETILLSWPPNQ